MSNQLVDRIQEFPRDGKLWWIRWVDRYCVPMGGTATSGVEVLLSPLDIPQAALLRANTRGIVSPRTAPTPCTQAPIRVLTGYIPRLAIGTVFLDGVEVGSLPLEEATYDLTDFTVSVLRISDELDTRPGWWAKGIPYRVINRREFSLAEYPDARNSWAVVIQAKEATIVMPCHEIFRTMYAPHSDIARALTKGPWELTKKDVINPERTCQRQNGDWQITLRRRVGNDFRYILANLCLSRSGRAAANSVYTSLIQNRGPGYLRAPIPFDPERLRFKVKGLRFDDKPAKFLALQLVEMDFPEFPAIALFRDNDSRTGDKQVPVPLDKPYSAKSASPTPDESGIINTSSDEDPCASTDVTNFTVASVKWGNLPEDIKDVKPESFIYEGRTKDSEATEVSRVSPGTESCGDSDSGPSVYSGQGPQIRDQSERIGKVIAMFEELRASEQIDNWTPVPPPQPLIINPNGVLLWQLPLYASDIKKPLTFSYLDRHHEQRRGALVCKLDIKGEAVYWLEIELRPNEPGRRALIYSVSDAKLLPVTYRLLQIAAEHRGKWPSEPHLAGSAYISASITWRHIFLDDKLPKQNSRLNSRLAMKAISQLLYLRARLG